MRTSQYFVSLPERVLRSVALLAAGLIREIGNVALPAGVRKTRFYKTMIESTLRFLIEQVGEVEGVYPSEDKLAERFLLKRVLGDGIDVIGMLAFHASPVWVLAALADVSGAGRRLMDEITTSLKDEGLLDRNANFETVDKILDGLERTSGQLASSDSVPTPRHRRIAQGVGGLQRSRSHDSAPQPAFAGTRARTMGSVEGGGCGTASHGIRAGVACSAVDRPGRTRESDVALSVCENGNVYNGTFLRRRAVEPLRQHSQRDSRGRVSSILDA